MRHRRRVAGQRFGAAQADRQLGDFKVIQKAKTLCLAALDKDREGGTGTAAMAVIDILLTRIVDHAEISQPRHLGMRFQERADLGGIFARPAHPQFERFEAAAQHPGGIGIANTAHHIAQHPHRGEPFFRARHAARDQIAMPAGIFGQAVNDDIRALPDRLLPQRPQKCIVDGDRRTILAKGCAARIAHGFDIDERIGGVGRAFEIDHRELAALPCGLFLGLRQNCIYFAARRARREIQIGDVKFAQYFGDETFAGGIKRAAMNDHIARRAIGEHQRANRGHSARKNQRIFGPVPQRQPALQYLLIGRVEARIDQPFGAAGTRAGDPFKMPFAGGRIFKHESRGEENRRFDRTFGQYRVKAMPHHQCCRG